MNVYYEIDGIKYFLGKINSRFEVIDLILPSAAVIIHSKENSDQKISVNFNNMNSDVSKWRYRVDNNDSIMKTIIKPLYNYAEKYDKVNLDNELVVEAYKLIKDLLNNHGSNATVNQVATVLLLDRNRYIHRTVPKGNKKHDIDNAYKLLDDKELKKLLKDHNIVTQKEIISDFLNVINVKLEVPEIKLEEYKSAENRVINNLLKRTKYIVENHGSLLYNYENQMIILGRDIFILENHLDSKNSSNVLLVMYDGKKEHTLIDYIYSQICGIVEKKKTIIVAKSYSKKEQEKYIYYLFPVNQNTKVMKILEYVLNKNGKNKIDPKNLYQEILKEYNSNIKVNKIF